MDTINLATRPFNSKQAQALTGTTPKKLIYWDNTGLVKPSMSQAEGRGSRRLYSYKDLLALKLVKGMRDEGLSLQRIRKCVVHLRRHMPDVSQPLHFCQLLTDGETAYLVEDERTLMDTVKRPGQKAFRTFVDIAAYDRELRSKVIQLVTKQVVEISVGDYAYQVEIEPDEEEAGYVATVAGLRGCITDGDTLDEVLDNAEDAIRCWLEARDELKADGVRIPIARARRRRRSRA